MKKSREVSTISERVEVAGVSAATLKLVDKGLESYDLFRSSRKIGTARVEPDGEWTARFTAHDGSWVAAAESGPALLQIVGRFS